MFTNGLGDWDSIPGQIIPKTKKWYLILPCLTLSINRYVSRVKWSNPGKRIMLSPTRRRSSYWKGVLRVVLDYGSQFILLESRMRSYQIETFKIIIGISLLIFLLKVKIHCQDRFQKLSLPTYWAFLANRVIYFWSKSPNQKNKNKTIVVKIYD